MPAIVEQAVNEGPLTRDEQNRLDALEKIIDSGLTKFQAVWAALLEIDESKLWREAYTSFNAYVRQRFDIERTHAHRLIAAARYSEKCSQLGTLPPSNEAQARAEMEALKQAELERREVRAWRDELKNLPTEEKRRQIMEAEREIIRRAREPKTISGAGQKDRFEAGLRCLRKAIRMFEGLGPEAEPVTSKIEEAIQEANAMVILPNAA